MRVAVKVRGISPITSSGVLSSFNSLIRKSSVVLNTAVSSGFSRTCRPIKKPPGLAAVWTLAAILFQIERDPPTASELS
jgi:hypothetical protein